MRKGKGNKRRKSTGDSHKPVIKDEAPNQGTKRKPRMKWQTGAYERHAVFRFVLPYQFLLLCRLMDVTPDQVLTDFMDNHSCGSWQREGRDKAKES